ncbi:ornithine cyclodeaminase family protein [Moritella viscosa]|uniref:Putative ornithine cyclodeaminase n=1 Tax=Moritella viscosa TaxID=80854 RepID=A0A1L0A9S2_9GAMM|nr:ornithine cyclodeaminase family protein [Moritella viscosa]SGZ08189.1 Putative ornithine cyclodeaminase [Moritella viscosa]SHO10317.1 Putative ornithine cyclodeaminase [Moritella viscosa]SHO10335.1 Putative ornithine cyclodeaminase [Moritella viscosa]SHO15515.1 Putative ornithine cyclodeaminase [Moritella viscosa]SHO17387.1 Putative ornithine cyclodeaminase [Moritella viscosa]
MKYISEVLSSQLISHELAFNAVSAAFIAASEQAKLFPVVIAEGDAENTIFSLKSANTAELVGWKVGSYWPGNIEKNIPCHASTIFLLDQETGRLDAVIEGSTVNAYRTSAADAVAVSVLAREDASCVAIFGTGHQAFYECVAVCRVRDIRIVLVVGRNNDKAQGMVEKLMGVGIDAQVTGAEEACRAADIIITATTAREALFSAEWVQAGTHISAMGVDTKGKQELPPALFDNAGLYCDFSSQSVVIGEFQHGNKEMGANQLTMIGDVLSGRTKGRVNNTDITIFDSSGIAVQDLFIGQHLLTAAAEAGHVISC